MQQTSARAGEEYVRHVARLLELSGETPEAPTALASFRQRADCVVKQFDAYTVLGPEGERLRVTTNPHPPNRYRVDGTLADLPEFAAAFGCKAGDPMVRPAAERCAVW